MWLAVADQLKELKSRTPQSQEVNTPGCPSRRLTPPAAIGRGSPLRLTPLAARAAAPCASTRSSGAPRLGHETKDARCWPRAARPARLSAGPHVRHKSCTVLRRKAGSRLPQLTKRRKQSGKLRYTVHSLTDAQPVQLAQHVVQHLNISGRSYFTAHLALQGVGGEVLGGFVLLSFVQEPPSF